LLAIRVSGASGRIAHRVAAAEKNGERTGETKMKTGEQVRPIPMRARRNGGDASLWDEVEWERMRQASAEIPATLQEALLMGYALNAGENWSRNCGGILSEEFVEGSFMLRREHADGPDLVLPYRARLEFGRVHLREKSEQEGESK
jgi:hypothetical protein